MSDYAQNLLAQVKAKNPSEPEFHQAVEEVLSSLELVLARHPEYRSAKILERMVEPERVVSFRPYRAKNNLIDRGVLPPAVYDRVKELIVVHREAEPALSPQR